MSDIEFSKRIREMNRKYIDHVGEDYKSPHTRIATAAKKYEHLEGGSVFSLIGQVAKVAAQASRAAAAAARASAKAAAKAAANAAKSATKSVVKSAKNTGRELKNLPSTIKNASAFDKARGAISAVGVAHDITSMVMGGSPITNAIWDSLSQPEKIAVDIHRWESQLPQNWRAEFARQGGNQAAAFATLRIMGQGPEDATTKQMDDSFDTHLDKLLADGIDYCNADEECPQCLERYGVSSNGKKKPPSNCYKYDLVQKWHWSNEGEKNPGNPGFDLCEGGTSGERLGLIQGLETCKGKQGQFDNYKRCIEDAAAEREKTRDDIKKALNIPKSEKINPAAVSQEDIAKWNAVHNQKFLVGDKLTIAVHNDYNIANGFTTPADIDRGLKAQSMAAYMIVHNDFTLEGIQDISPYKDWLKDDPSLFNRALGQSRTPNMFSPNTPYQNTKDFLSSIGEGVGVTKTAANFKLEARYLITVEDNNDVIQSGVDEVQNDDFMNAAKNAAAFDANKVYEKGDMVTKDGITYEYIDTEPKPPLYEPMDHCYGSKVMASDGFVYMWNDSRWCGSQAVITNGVVDNHWTKQPNKPGPPDPKYWEVIQNYNTDELNEITKLGNAVLWNAQTKYNVGDYVTYMNDTFVMTKEAKAGTLPTDNTSWTKVDVMDPKAFSENKINYPPWDASKSYAVGDKCFYKQNSNYYSATVANQGVRPVDGKDKWQQVYMFTLTPEMKEDIKLNQRIATYTQAVEGAMEYEPDALYDIGDVVQAPNGDYYRLIKLKTDKSGQNVPVPRPPQATYWEKVSAGEKEYKDTEKYNINDIVTYKDKSFLNMSDTPIGTAPLINKMNPTYPEDFQNGKSGDNSDARRTSVNSKYIYNIESYGPNPLYDVYWKPLESVFEDITDDVKESYVEAQRQLDLALTEDFDYQKDGYDEGDFVTTYDDTGIPTIWRCIKSYSLDYDDKATYPVGAVVVKDGKYYYHIRQSDPGMVLSNELYWRTASDKETMDYVATFGPPNATYWSDSAETTDEGKQQAIVNKAKDWSVPSNDANAQSKLIQPGDAVLDSTTSTYWTLSQKPELLKTIYPESDKPRAEKYYYDPRYLEKPNEMPEGKYNTYYSPYPPLLPDTDLNNIYLTKDGKTIPYPVNNSYLDYRWDIIPEMEDKATELEQGFENQHKWKPSKAYKTDDIVVYQSYYFRALKDVPIGILPFQKDGTVNSEYYDYIDKESEISKIHEDYSDKVQSEQATAEENASLQYIASNPNAQKYVMYNDLQVVFNNGKYYQFQSFDKARPGTGDNQTIEPGDLTPSVVNKWGRKFTASWLECDIDGNLMPVSYSDYQNTASWENGGPIVHYNNKQYVMNGHQGKIFGIEGQAPIPADAPTFDPSIQCCVAPSDKDPSWWVEVYDDMTPVNKIDPTTGKIIGQNPAPTKTEVAEAINPESTTARQAQCPTMDDDDEDEEDDSHHADVEAAKALEKAHEEWVAKGKQGPEPGVSTMSGKGIDYDELGIISKKRKYVRKNKNIRKK